MDAIKKYAKWIGLGGCLLVIIGVFLPFLGVSVGSYSNNISYMEASGRVLFITLAMAEILLFLKQEKYAIVPSAISLFFVIYDIAKNSDYSVKAGAYIMIVGIIIVIVSSILPLFKSSGSNTVNTEQPVVNPAPVAQPIVQAVEPAPVQPAVQVAPAQPVIEPAPAPVQPTAPTSVVNNGQNTQI